MSPPSRLDWWTSGLLTDMVPTLDFETVHIWRYPRTAPCELLQPYRTLLDSEERRRADRFALPGLGEAYVSTHAVLRLVLSGYLYRDPKALAFERRRHGKPALVQPLRGTVLEFNLSHSGELALCGLALNRELGVDVERVRSSRDVMGVAGRYFSPKEASELRSLHRSRQVEAFYAGWVRKEAYIKARGDGLSRRLDSFDVTINPGSEVALLRSEAEPGEPSRWTMANVPVPNGYTAAVAFERRMGASAVGGVEPTKSTDGRSDGYSGEISRLVMVDLRYGRGSAPPSLEVWQQRIDCG